MDKKNKQELQNGRDWYNEFQKIDSCIIYEFNSFFEKVYKEEVSPAQNLIKCLSEVKDNQDKMKSDIAQALKYIRSGSIETGIAMLQNIIGDNYVYEQYDKKDGK